MHEDYLLGKLAAEDRDAFEQHYFACDRCFGGLQTLIAVRKELAAQSKIQEQPAKLPFRWAWSFAPVAAVLLLAIAVSIWRWEGQNASPTPVKEPVASASPSQDVTTDLQELARFAPPHYDPVVVRGMGEEQREFDSAMRFYRNGDFAAAAARLAQALKANPRSPHVLFFLGVSELLDGKTDEGISHLHRTVATGDTPFVEEAHFFLAKAFLRKGDIAAAEGELQRVVLVGGDLQQSANELLNQLRKQRTSP